LGFFFSTLLVLILTFGSWIHCWNIQIAFYHVIVKSFSQYIVKCILKNITSRYISGFCIESRSFWSTTGVWWIWVWCEVLGLCRNGLVAEIFQNNNSMWMVRYIITINLCCWLTVLWLLFVNLLFITFDKGGGTWFCPCLSVYLLARLPKNACMDLDEMLHVDRCWDMDELINFWARSGS